MVAVINTQFTNKGLMKVTKCDHQHHWIEYINESGNIVKAKEIGECNFKNTKFQHAQI